MFVQMNVSGLAIDPTTNTPLVVLKDSSQKNTLPIWIGIFEASAIATQLENVQLTRPMTHDLLRNLVGGLGGELLRIEVNDLRENTFFANLVLRKPSGDEIVVDARPSDAIALALRCGAPIFVAEEVIARSAQNQIQMKPLVSALDKDQMEELLKNLSDDAFGKYRM